MLRILSLCIAILIPSLACAGSIHGSAGAAPPATCPKGTSYTNALGVGDGCAGANVNGSYQDKTWFADVAQSGQTLQRPTAWNVAGVDYPVGYDKTLTLKDPTVLGNIPAACTLVAGTGSVGNLREWHCVLTTDLVINGFDFSIGQVGGVSTPGACTYIIIVNSAHNVTFSNNNFVKGPNCYQQANIDISVGNTGNRTYTNNTFNGNFGASPPDPEFMVVDNSTAGIATFEYNYCPAPQDVCIDGAFPTSVIYYYNVGPWGGNYGGTWTGSGTVSGSTFTVTGTTGGTGPPLVGQQLLCTGSCTGFNPSGVLFIDSGGPTVFTLHQSLTGGSFSTLNSKANHNAVVEAFDSGNPITLEDYEFNTVYVPAATPNCCTAPFELNGALASQILTHGVDANNTFVTNKAGGPSGVYSTESAILHISLAGVTTLDVLNNYVDPTGALFCMTYARIVSTINGYIDDGLGGGSYDGVPGNILTVTSVPGQFDEIPVGGNLVEAAISGVLTIRPYGTSGTTGTGVPGSSTGTYALSGSAQAVPAKTDIGVTGYLGTLNFSGNVDMLDGSAITTGGSQYNAGACFGHS